LAACEGAILLVDATQGVQAQTLAHLQKARSHNLTIIPVINKIDLPNARTQECVEELRSLAFRKEDIIHISAKTGENVENVLEAVVKRIPAPTGAPNGALRALVFSSQYDSHKGVVVFVRIVDGSLQGDALQIVFIRSKAHVTPIEIGYFNPKMIPCDMLSTGEVGYIATGLKDVRMAKVGDTVTVSTMQTKNQKNATSTLQQDTNTTIAPLPGYQEPQPMVFLGLYPVTNGEYHAARQAMEKLRLSDSAFIFRPVSSLALGRGFHCGFLGLLHADVVQERLLREFGLAMIATAPSVEYLVKLVSRRGAHAGTHGVNLPQGVAPSISSPPSAIGVHFNNTPLPVHREQWNNGAMQQCIVIQSAAEFPDPTLIEEVLEPIMRVCMYSPQRYIGAIMQLSQEKRGECLHLEYVSHPTDGNDAPASEVKEREVKFTYLLPLSEMIIDFFDRLKSITEGYASLDYELFGWRKADVVKVDILVNHEKVDALSFLTLRDQARRRAVEVVEKLAVTIPRAQFSIPIQGALGRQIIARADVKPFRKDVIGKLYGGDRTRKDKLLEAQKRGKAKMKLIGRVEIPPSAFLEVLKRV